MGEPNVDYLEEGAAPAEEPTGTAPTEQDTGAPTPTDPIDEAEEPEAGNEPGEDQPAEDQPPDEDPEPKIDPEVKRLQDQINALHRRLEKQDKKKPAAPKVPEPIDEKDAPKEDDFDTVEEYEAAKSAFDIDRRVNEQVRKALEVDESANHQAELNEFAKSALEAGPQQYKDFQEVVGKDTLPITAEIIDAVRTMDNEAVTPADIFYYLGKNEAETVRISRLNPVQVAREIVKIENAIAKARGGKAPSVQSPTPTKTVTAASEPIRPTGASVIITKDPEKMTQAEYEKWRAEGGGE
jgi:hypothetical protein